MIPLATTASHTPLVREPRSGSASRPERLDAVVSGFVGAGSGVVLSRVVS
jgi:hypothetical protein